MAVTRQAVFIASNFDEFRELRGLLHSRIQRAQIEIEAINLDDNIANTARPLDRSLVEVEKSEVFVLLLGNEYGGRPPAHSKSYAHLEYDAAKNAGGAIVCVFVGPGFCDAESSLYGNELLRGFKQEIIENHTPSFHDSDSISPADIAEIIFDSIVAAIFSPLSGQDGLRLSSWDEDLGQVDEELELELDLGPFEKEFDPRGDLILPEIPHEDLPRHQSKLQAREKTQLAMEALDIGERRDAIYLLREALKDHPLDRYANYWLARLLSMMGRQSSVREALTLALKARKVSKGESNTNFAIACSIVASRAATQIGDREEAIKLAENAVQLAPYRHVGHVELATRLFETNQYAKCYNSIKSAFLIDPRAIFLLQGAASMKSRPKEFRKLKQRLRSDVLSQARQILQSELCIQATILELPKACPANEFLDGSESEQLRDKLGALPVSTLLVEGRRSGARQLHLLRELTKYFANDMNKLDEVISYAQERVDVKTALLEETKAGLELRIRDTERLRITKGWLLRGRSWLAALVCLAPVGVILIIDLLMGPLHSDESVRVSGAFKVLIGVVVATVALLSVFAVVGNLVAGLVRRSLTRKRHIVEQQAAHELLTSVDGPRTLVEHSVRLTQEFCPKFQSLVMGFDKSVMKWASTSPAVSFEAVKAGAAVRCTAQKLEGSPDTIVDKSVLPPALRPFGEKDFATPDRFIASPIDSDPTYLARWTVFWK